MTQVDIDQELYDRAKKAVDKDNIVYASIKHFVNLAVKEKLNELGEQT